MREACILDLPLYTGRLEYGNSQSLRTLSFKVGWGNELFRYLEFSYGSLDASNENRSGLLFHYRLLVNLDCEKHANLQWKGIDDKLFSGGYSSYYKGLDGYLGFLADSTSFTVLY